MSGQAGKLDLSAALVGWIVALLIVVLPGGAITQIWNAKDRVDRRYAKSALGEICYYCREPATHSQKYSNGEVLYFCDKHKAPGNIVRQYASISTAGNGYNPVFCTGLVLLIYLGNLLNVAAGFLFPLRKKMPTFQGSLWGIVSAAVFWFWFHSL